MGKAKILSHIGDGKYSVTYYREHAKIELLKTQVTKNLDAIAEALLTLKDDIDEWDAIVNEDVLALSDAIDDYQNCVNQNPESPLLCAVQYEYTVKATDVKLKNEKTYLELITQESRLLLSQKRWNEEKALLDNSALEEETLSLWCLDLCSRATAQPAIGIWQNVGEVIPDNAIVGIIELYNYATKEYDRWIVPSSYSRSHSYSAGTHGTSVPSLHCNADAFVYNFEVQAPNIAQDPMFRKAIVTELNNVIPFIKVKLTAIKDFDGVSLNDGYSDTLEGAEVAIDYMNDSVQPMPAGVFDIGDEVLISFDTRFTNPTVIGFTSNPKAYPPVVGFVCYDMSTHKMFTTTWNGTSWVESAQYSAYNYGSDYWNRLSDGAFISWGTHLGYLDDFSNTFSAYRDKIWIDGVSYSAENTTVVGVTNPIREWAVCGASMQGIDMYVVGQDYDTTTAPNNGWGGLLVTLKYVFLTDTWSLVAREVSGGQPPYQEDRAKLTQDGLTLFIRSTTNALYTYDVMSGVNTKHAPVVYGINDCDENKGLYRKSISGHPAGMLYNEEGEPEIQESTEYQEWTRYVCGGSSYENSNMGQGIREGVNYYQTHLSFSTKSKFHNPGYDWSYTVSGRKIDRKPLCEQPWLVEAYEENNYTQIASPSSGYIPDAVGIAYVDDVVHNSFENNTVISGTVIDHSTSSSTNNVQLNDCQRSDEFNCNEGDTNRGGILVYDIIKTQVIRIAPNGQFMIAYGTYSDPIVGSADPRGYMPNNSNYRVIGFTSGYKKQGGGDL